MTKGKRYRVFARQFERVSATAGTLAVPVNRGLTNAFLDTLDLLEAPEGTVVLRKEGTCVHRVREWLAQNFRGDWVFFVDADHMMDPGTLTRLLSHRVPIVSGLYFMRGADFSPHAYTYDHYDEATHTHRYQPMKKQVVEYLRAHKVELADAQVVKLLPKPELWDVDAVGGGCLLVRREAFERIPPPWFDGEVAEDFSFCRRALAAGLKVHLDPSVLVGHMYEMPVGWLHFMAKEGLIK